MFGNVGGLLATNPQHFPLCSQHSQTKPPKLYTSNNPKFIHAESEHRSGPENGDVAEPGSYTVLLRFALAYGWKAIQIITISLRKYAYIEAMACPHGCVNGGGGVKVTEDDEYAPKETSAEIKARVAKARRIVTDEWGR